MTYWLDRGIGCLINVIKWAALVIALLLFMQWPLREWVQAYSRETNDTGQWLFALFVAASVTAATRSNRHIAAESLARAYSPLVRGGLQIFGIVFGLVPWALFVAWSGWTATHNSVLQLERFQDTGNAGYFIVKVALLLLVILMLAQAIADLASRGGRDPA